MNKFFLAAAAILVSTATFGQKQNIQNASNELRDKNYKEAISYSTNEDPKAWFVKGNIYMSMQELPEFKSQNPYREAVDAYLKVASLKPKYEKEAIDPALIYLAQLYYNDAVNAYNSKEYNDAFTYAQKVKQIAGLEDGKRFANNKPMRTTASNALVIQTYSAYYANKFDEAMPLLNDLKADTSVRDANVYMIIADIYAKQGAADKQIATLEEGRKVYPDNPNLRNEELNYYIKTGQQDVLMKKLEDAVTKDPNSAILHFNLANGYMGLAAPKDVSGKDLPKPANSAEYLSKAEASYMKALAIDAKNAEYNYNTGVLYFNQASDINKQMNSLGSTAADDKKYKELEVQRNSMFNKAAPYFEAACAELEAKLSSLGAEDKFTYQSALVALKEIYAKQDKLDKSAEMKKKLDASKK
jgi:hypothetical protein